MFSTFSPEFSTFSCEAVYTWCIVPVSYTHLDVYKRQLYYTVAIREPLAQPATLPLLASLAAVSYTHLV